MEMRQLVAQIIKEYNTNGFYTEIHNQVIEVYFDGDLDKPFLVVKPYVSAKNVSEKQVLRLIKDLEKKYPEQKYSIFSNADFNQMSFDPATLGVRLDTLNKVQAIGLLPHNKSAYLKIKQAWASSKKVAVAHATGTGKTYLILECLKDFVGKNVLVLSSSTFILDQINERAQEWGLGDGVKFMTYAKTMFLLPSEIEDMNIDLIVLDEFHRTGATKWGAGVETVLTNSDCYVLGTSATPVRYLDSARNMAEEMLDGNVVSTINLPEAIVQGILPSPIYVSALYTLEEEYEALKAKIEKVESEENSALLEQLNTYKANWQSALGVPEVLNKHLTGGHKKFIIFTKDSSHLDYMQNIVVNWFKEATGLLVNTYDVQISKGEAYCTRQLKAFEQARSKDSIDLLFSIEMLNEGVHIGSVDGVVLLRPTQSPIIFYQQIGRALQSIGGQKQPLIFDFVNNFNNIGAKEFSKEVKKYNHRSNTERKKRGLEQKESNIMILDYTKDAVELFTNLESKIQSNWDVMFEKVKWHYDNNKEIIDSELRAWCKIQRRCYQSDQLSKKAIEKLESINFCWDLIDKAWNNKFEELSEFINLQGCFPSSGSLSIWVTAQRGKYWSKQLSEDQISKLNKLNIIWDVYKTKWDEAIGLYQRYLENKTSLSKEQIDKTERWIVTQKTKRNRGQLHQDKISQLDNMGFYWGDSRADTWDSKLSRYQLMQTSPELIDENEKESLIRWSNVQRTRYNKGDLLDERMQRLISIGFIFDQHDAFWWDRYRLYKQGGPYTKEEKESLRSWKTVIRQKMKHKTLSKDKIMALQDIKFLWDPHKERWDENYQKYVKALKEGDRIIENPSLYGWAKLQRSKKRKGTLEQDYIDKLNAIGFKW